MKKKYMIYKMHFLKLSVRDEYFVKLVGVKSGFSTREDAERHLYKMKSDHQHTIMEYFEM